MSIQTEFLLIALALFLWESLLWLPMRNPVLRRRWRSRRWLARVPGHSFATRVAGMLPLLPAPLEGGFAPCQAPPLFPDKSGAIFVEAKEADFQKAGAVDWKHLGKEGHHLLLEGKKIRLTSARQLAAFSAGKRGGLTVEQSIQKQWRLALSPARAGREWRRWRTVSFQLRLLAPILTYGFFLGIPLLYLYTSLLQTLLFGAWLWLIMAFISAQLWWLGRVYPAARAALRMDALLSLLVPFHAMRAAEMASVHAFATTHPFALLLSSRDRENPWLARFARRVLFPAAESPGDIEYSAFIRPLLEKHVSLENYNIPPVKDQGDESTRYCPRCHGLFLATSDTCTDCRGVRLKEF